MRIRSLFEIFMCIIQGANLFVFVLICTIRIGPMLILYVLNLKTYWNVRIFAVMDVFSNIRIFSFIWAFRCVFLKFFYVDTFSTKNLRIFCRFAYCVLFLRFLFFVHVHCTYICGQMLWLCMLRFTSSSDMTSSGDNGGQESTDGQHQLTIQVDQVQAVLPTGCVYAIWC